MNATRTLLKQFSDDLLALATRFDEAVRDLPASEVGPPDEPEAIVRKRKRWSTEEDKQLLGYMEANTPIQEIATLMNRSLPGIVVRMEIVRKFGPGSTINPRRGWSAAEIGECQSRHARGETVEQIAAGMGRSIQSIRNRLGKLS